MKTLARSIHEKPRASHSITGALRLGVMSVAGLFKFFKTSNFSKAVPVKRNQNIATKMLIPFMPHCQWQTILVIWLLNRSDETDRPVIG